MSFKAGLLILNEAYASESSPSLKATFRCFFNSSKNLLVHTYVSECLKSTPRFKRGWYTFFQEGDNHNKKSDIIRGHHSAVHVLDGLNNRRGVR